MITAALTGAVFLTLAFLGSSGRLPPPASVALALFPPLAGVVAVCWRTRARWVALPAWPARWRSRSCPALHSPRTSARCGSSNMSRSIFARRSFSAGHCCPGAEPLVTRIARAMRPSMPQEVVRVHARRDRRLDNLFRAMAALSVALYFGSSIAVWSAFATFSLRAGGGTDVLVRVRAASPAHAGPVHRATIAQSIAGFRALVRATCAAATGAEASAPHG